MIRLQIAAGTAHQRADFGGMRFEREMPGIQRQKGAFGLQEMRERAEGAPRTMREMACARPRRESQLPAKACSCHQLDRTLEQILPAKRDGRI